MDKLPAELLGPPQRPDPAVRRKRAAEARLREAQAAERTLERRRDADAERRQALAKRQVEDLKARLRMVRSTAPADAKAATRLAAQLARDLAVAARAYAAAGGPGAGIGVSAAALMPADATRPGPATERQDAQHRIVVAAMADIRKLSDALKAMARRTPGAATEDSDEARDIKAAVAVMDREVGQAETELSGGLSLVV